MNSYYWEADILSLGEGNHNESGPSLSFGFMPNHLPTDSAWTVPPGSCMLHSTGRAIRYVSGDPLSWKSVTFNLSMREHDIIGCGWEAMDREENTTGVGTAFFTHNGKRLSEVLEGVERGLFPVVHIQKKVIYIFKHIFSLLVIAQVKNCKLSYVAVVADTIYFINFLALPLQDVRVFVNFGTRLFHYQDANTQKMSIESVHSSSVDEVRADLAELPFSNCTESDELEEIVVHTSLGPVQNSEGLRSI